MIFNLFLAGVGAGSFAFLLVFLAALSCDSKTGSRRDERPKQSLAVTMMERYQRDKRAA